MSLLVIHLMTGFIISIDFGKLFIKIWYLFLIKAHNDRNPVCTGVCNSHTHTHQTSCLMVGLGDSLEVRWWGLGAVTARAWGLTPGPGGKPDLSGKQIPQPNGTAKNKTINYFKKWWGRSEWMNRRFLNKGKNELGITFVTLFFTTAQMKPNDTIR